MSWNVRVSAPIVTKEGVAVLALFNVTISPSICIHENVNESPSGSVLLEPSRFTVSR